jgi:glutaredoxin
MKQRKSFLMMHSSNKPAYAWDCPHCKFVKQLIIKDLGSNDVKRHDIYKSCSSHSDNEPEYIIIHSDKEGDYSSSVTMNILFMYYCLEH